MNIYVLIMYVGMVGGSIGPVPYDMVECRSRAFELQEKTQAMLANDPEKLAKITANDPRFKSPSDIRFVCVESAERPKSDPSLKMK